MKLKKYVQLFVTNEHTLELCYTVWIRRALAFSNQQYTLSTINKKLCVCNSLYVPQISQNLLSKTTSTNTTMAFLEKNWITFTNI